MKIRYSASVGLRKLKNIGILCMSVARLNDTVFHKIRKPSYRKWAVLLGFFCLFTKHLSF
jgi:hypothetical protein